METDKTKADIVLTDDKKQVSMFDGLSNLSTGLGGAKDKAQHNVWNHSGKNFDHVALSARFREDWISQKIVKIVPQDMTREWRKFESPKARMADKQQRVSALFKEAYQWARLYGTSFIILDIKDGRTIDKPVNWKKLKAGCITSMQVVDRTRITTIGDIEQSPMSPDFGMPVQYQFVNSQTPIHKDRIIRFEGTELPIYERQRNLWYSDSTLIPLMPQIDNFHTSSFAAAQMVQEANTDIIKVNGLSNILQTDEGTNAMLNRFTEWKQIKSVFGVSILDASEEYESKKIQLSGVKDLIWEYLKIVAASVGIPATRFLSASPDGMNATGESDQINYVEFLQGLQKDIFDPRVDVVDRLLSVHYGIPLEEFEYTWKCIFPESATQKQEREKTESDKLATLTEAGIISRESALAEAKKSGLVSLDATVGDNPNPPTPTLGAKDA
jgi:phage-related protein (TIGR01555 family)